MTTVIDPATVLRATKDAGAALASAMSIAQQKQTDLLNQLSDAKIALDAAEVAFAELEVEVRKASPDVQALQAKAAQATANSAAALKSSSELIGAVGFVGTIGSPVDEWKECRATIDRCDKILVDLRKTGFGFVTAVVGAATFLFSGATDFSAKSSILVMLVVLIATLYFIDLAHQTWLGVAVKTAGSLEKRLGFSLTQNIGVEFAAARAVGLGFWLYFILLFATCAIFWFSVPKEAPMSGHHITVGVAFFVGLASMIIGLCVSHKK
ncbi:MAG: hypothetical protein JWP25_6550 [Bradyrhizobium sp.]|nr:hypothetical protein [Bradyrhizobium sp.]